MDKTKEEYKYYPAPCENCKTLHHFTTIEDRDYFVDYVFYCDDDCASEHLVGIIMSPEVTAEIEKQFK